VSKAIVFASEADVKHAVKKILDELGCFYFMPPSGAFGRSGISDFLGLKNGKFFAIETKFGSNKPTPQQLKFGEKVMAHGGIFVWVNETNYYSVKLKLEMLL